MVAYAGGDDGDSSETETEQSIKQKNVGSGASTNVNCADNDINSFSLLEAQLCGTGSRRPRRRLATTHGFKTNQPPQLFSFFVFFS